MLQQGAAS